jgi:hypothetical protein
MNNNHRIFKARNPVFADEILSAVWLELSHCFRALNDFIYQRAVPVTITWYKSLEKHIKSTSIPS